MKINMSVWITENSNILSYDDVIANERNTIRQLKLLKYTNKTPISYRKNGSGYSNFHFLTAVSLTPRRFKLLQKRSWFVYLLKCNMD